MGIGAAIKRLFGGGGSRKPVSIKKALRARSASDRAWLAVRATGRALPGLLTEPLSPERLRLAIGSLIAVQANLGSPDDEAIYRLVYDLHAKHWNGDHDESGSVETSIAFLTNVIVDPKSPPEPAREAIDFAKIGLVEHLVRRADTEPDWTRIKEFEPIVEAPLHADLAQDGTLEGMPVWQDNLAPDGIDADWSVLRDALEPSWAACLDALRQGQAPRAEDERLALDSLAAMLNDHASKSLS